MRRSPLAPIFIALILSAGSAAADELFVDVIASLRGSGADGPPSWLERGFGKMGPGGDSDGSEKTSFFGDLYVGVDWRPIDRFGLVATGVARAEPSDHEGSSGGVVEAYAEGILFFREADRLRLRGGMFFLPTSRENSGPMWSSPYAISFSAINSWIGEEVRPIGVDLDYRIDAPTRLSVGATLFGGNDTMGTLTGWRGWSVGNRLTVYGEHLPLPPLWSLDQTFIFQRKETTPFRDDLDGSPGWSARARLDRPEEWVVQYTYLDNRGDRARYGDEYSWATSFHLLAAEWTPRPELTLASEALLGGSTAMGLFVPVDADFSSAYVLGSWAGNRWRATLRREWFETVERDHDPRAENNDEEGWAWTGAFFWSLNPSLMVGVEVVDVNATHEAAAESGFPRQVGGTSATVELRWTWGN